MKQLFKKLFVVLALFLTVFSLQTNSVNALQSSRSYKTGYKSGQVIQKSYSYYGAGRSRYRYVKTRDVYVSEKVYTDQWAKDVTNWNSLTTLQNLSYNKSSTISATGSTDVIKAMGLKTSVTIGKSTSAGGSHKADPKKGSAARLSIKSDYVVITYDHYTFNNKGRQTGKSRKTVKVPIPGTQVYYVRYSK